MLEQGTIADPSLDLYFPSIAANPYGVVMICCSGSGAGTYISSYAYAGQTVNGQTTFGSQLLLRAGVANYHDLTEVLSQLLSDTPTPSRWGDYSTLSVDPADPTQFWIIQAFASGEDPTLGTGIWSTQITQLITTAPPQLAIVPDGTNVVVSWPLYAAGYQLFSATNLAPPIAWSSVSQQPVTNGLQISVTMPQAGGGKLFRLQR